MKIEQAIKQYKFESNVQKAFVNLMYTANQLRDTQKIIFEPFDILPQHFNILRIIKGKHPNAISPGEIKEVMLDKAPDITRLLDKLVKLGLINRQTCNQNRRKIDITLTQKGLNELKKLNESVAAYTKKLEKNISEKEAAILSNLLDKLRG
jgi:DNA-binding MarR family transcriptional regulator